MAIFIFVIAVMVVGYLAQNAVRSNFDKYSKQQIRRGLTGTQVARQLLDSHGLSEVRIEPAQGLQLSDHYDPGERVLRLSTKVGQEATIAAAGIAAHEAGHAIQHAEAYPPLMTRTNMVPMIATGTKIVSWLIPIGVILQASIGLRQFGIPILILSVVLYVMMALMALTTLPVEFDASARAKRLLYQHQILDRKELEGVDAVLKAAAWTYVAAALSAIGRVFYWFIRR